MEAMGEYINRDEKDIEGNYLLITTNEYENCADRECTNTCWFSAGWCSCKSMVWKPYTYWLRKMLELYYEHVLLVRNDNRNK